MELAISMYDNIPTLTTDIVVNNAKSAGNFFAIDMFFSITVYLSNDRSHRNGMAIIMLTVTQPQLSDWLTAIEFNVLP